MPTHLKPTALIAALLLVCYGITLFKPFNNTLLLEAILFAVALFILVKSASLFTTLATVFGEYLGISRLATGILIIAIGTSAPELFASIGAALQGEPEIVVGNVLGTIIANSLLGIGCGALAATTALTVHKNVLGTQMSVFLTAILLALGGLYDGVLHWYEGIIFVTVLGFYLRHVVRSSRQPTPDTSNTSAIKTKLPYPLPLLLLFLGLNLAALFLSGDLVVSALIAGASALDISSTKLATSILAIGTSIPEIATAIALVRQNNADGLFGEIIGSNIFDLLGILGLIALFMPLGMQPPLLVYLGGATFAMFVITNRIMSDRQINRLEGVALIALFSLFTLQLVHL